MSKLIALLDACVLYPAPLRDLFMQLALTDLFQAKWSHNIHEEWIRNLLKNRPNITKEKLEKMRAMMDNNIRDCLVENYESIISTLSLPDKNDRHVLAAAIKSSSSVIVTFNLKDFPKKTLKQHKVKAQHPDDFIVNLFAMNP